MIKRLLQKELESELHKGKAMLLLGARQVGKTTLLKQLQKNLEENVLWLNCDIKETRETLSDCNFTELKMLIGESKTVIIDEAQRISDIGLTLKLITDNMPDVQLLVSGSSAFELRNRLNEPLTGRKYEYQLFPISTQEIYQSEGLIAVKQRLESRLIFGSYPEVICNLEKAKKILMELTESYLYKDILELEGIRKSAVLDKLLIALSLQVGSEVSYNELAKTVGIDSKTVEKYINILEKCYIVFQLNSFNRNIRTELSKGKKIYFYDNGIRNAVIQNFAPLNLRNDNGALWENFFISERLKANHYTQRYVRSYFWRTTEKQKIDYIEESDGQLHLFEMKWNEKKGNVKVPNVFLETYHPDSTTIITPANYLQHLINI